MANEAFGEFVEMRWAPLVRAAMLLGCPRADAEDLVQSTLVRCLVHWPKVQRADDPDAYAYRILLNTLASARRRRWSAEYPTETLPEQPSDGDTAATVEARDTARRLLAPLSAEQRTVVVLRYFADLSERQLAAILRVPVGTVKSRTARALKLLADDPAVAELRGPR